jgi:uncharacterized protein YjbI with pentapeptide repeats
MKSLTSDLREKINTYIKNKIDISTLIEDVDIKNENLSYAIIENFNRQNTDISGCNFSHCLLGNPKTIFRVLSCKMNNCNFDSAKFVGPTWIRSCEAKNCNFRNADVSKVDYQYSNFDNSTFCNAIITIGTTNGIGCVFPASMFEDLCKGWNMKIKVEKTQ